jgi:hypothetical protein
MSLLSEFDIPIVSRKVKKGSQTMIVNLNELPTLQAEWQGVVRMRDRIRNLVISTFALDARRSPIFGDMLYNLPCLLAFDVLKRVLLQASEAGQAIGSQGSLSELMESAKTSLPWIDWHSLREAVNRQNKVAREGKLFGDIQCLDDIAVVETQLIAWDIIADEPRVSASSMAL